LGKQRQRFRRRDVLNIMHVPVIQPMLPLREPFSHKGPMFSLFDGDHEIGAGQVVGRALPWEAISIAGRDRHLP
jgi:hypothetical protein